MTNEIEKNNGEIITYRSEDAKIKLEVRLEERTVWLTIDQMAELYRKARSRECGWYAAIRQDSRGNSARWADETA